MTRTTNARIAGFTYLFYAAIGICGDLLMHQASGVDGDAATLARFGEYATERANRHPDYAARSPLGPRAGRDAVRDHARRGP